MYFKIRTCYVRRTEDIFILDLLVFLKRSMRDHCACSEYREIYYLVRDLDEMYLLVADIR